MSASSRTPHCSYAPPLWAAREELLGPGGVHEMKIEGKKNMSNGHFYSSITLY